MARRKIEPPAPAGPSTTLVSSGKMLSGVPELSKAPTSSRGWQTKAWHYYDTIGEFRYLCDQMGTGLSKARLEIRRGGELIDDPSDPAVELLDALYGGRERHPEMLSAFGINLAAPGDCYLMGVDREGRDEWHVVSATEIRRNKRGEWSAPGVDLGGQRPFLMRLWRPHPRNKRDSNSPARAVLPILSEIEGLTKHVAAQIDSRLASAGLLLIPENFTFAAMSNLADSEATNQADVFLAQMVEVMATAIKDRESAAALVPIPIQGPSEGMDKWRHLTFWSPLSEEAIALRTEAIRRLALGMDFPPELLLGTGESTHWTAAWQDESAVKSHILPMAELVAQSLTAGYLYPLLSKTVDPEEASQYAITVDTSEIRLRPDRSEEAVELYDRGAIKHSVLLREVGFAEEDAMSEEELRRWMLVKVAQGQTTPELVAQALAQLGLDFVSSDTTSHEARPTPSLDDHPERRTTPDPDNQESQALLAACEMAVYRALERAGNRLKARHNGRSVEGVSRAEFYKFYPCDAKALDYLLEDAWESLSYVEHCRSGKVDQGALAQALDGYVRVLIREQADHDPALMAAHVALATQKVPMTLEGLT